jgi:hypothetical protein
MAQAPKSNHRRGFFFTIMALAILTFMLANVQVWVRTFEQGDLSASQSFKGEAMRLVLSTLSDRSLSKFANSSAFYATYKLDNFTSNVGYGLGPAQSSDLRNPYTGRVNSTVYSLMLNGTAFPAAGLGIVYSDAEKQVYTISAWQDTIRQAANVMGFTAAFSNVSNFSLSQTDRWDVQVQFDIQMNISDLDGTMHQSKMLHANATFPIDGFLDPMIRRSDASQRCNGGTSCVNFAERQYFRNPQYSQPSDLAPRLLSPAGVDGAGWFYGPITEDYPDTIQQSQISTLFDYVLVHQFDDNMTTYADAYGAVVVTNEPVTITYNYTDRITGCVYNVTEQTQCINCQRINSSNMPGCPTTTEMINPVSVPYIVVSGTNWVSSIQPIVRAGLDAPLNNQRFVLIDNTADRASDRNPGDYHRLWDLNGFRDPAMCGFYVTGPGPSFFQRMLFNAQNINNDDLGIETFVVGGWAGGANDTLNSHPVFSRLDWEFYRGLSGLNGLPSGIKIKGAPGCKNVEVCAAGNQSAVTDSVGKFSLSQDAINRYGLGAIACNNMTGAHCEVR